MPATLPNVPDPASTPVEGLPPTPPRNPFLGSGGLMGPHFVITGLQVHRSLEALRVYILTSLWLLIVLEFFIGLLLLLPLKLFGRPGRNAYIRASIYWDWISMGALLVVPFSWCGCTVYTASKDVMMSSKAHHSSLWMSNHSSRIDWLIGMLCGYAHGPGWQRVNVRFIAEFTTALMPIAGWSRYLLDDIYLRRTFHRDKVNIRKKLASYKAVEADRMLFFAPEGAIADVGNAKDAQYIDACEAFIAELGRPKMRFLLTPRYKGLSVFAEHSPDNVVSATMVFISPCEPFGRDISIASNGAVVGGSLCTLPIRDDNRVVPDIHTVFGGNLHVFTHCKFMQLPSDEDGGGHQLRDQLLDDYARKDGELSTFLNSRKFSGVASADDWVRVPCNHLKMNLTVAVYAVIGVAFTTIVQRRTVYGALVHCVLVWVTFVVLHAVSHVVGVAVSGHHRESLPGESAFKAIVQVVKGGLNHGDGHAKAGKKE